MMPAQNSLQTEALVAIANLDDAGRAELARVLMLSLFGPEGLVLMFGVMAEVDAHANEIYRIEFEKEC